MKNKIIITILALTSFGIINAQEVINSNDFKTSDFRQDIASKGELASPSEMADGIEFKKDSVPLNLPTLTDRGTMTPINMYPLYYCGWNSWDLHPGLNMNIGASVFASFGHNAYHGAGFAQNISLMYAIPLNKRLSLAIGGYFNNMTWGGNSYRDAGINAVLGYQLNEHWSGYLYAQKSLVNTSIPMPLYGMNDIGDRIGAAIRYAPNKTFSVQVSVEADKYPDAKHRYLPTAPGFNKSTDQFEP